MILAPLRGVTIRSFRESFASVICANGFDEAFTPFITATKGFDPLKDRELKGLYGEKANGIRLTPQFIGKDPTALKDCLRRIIDAGFVTADLNCGCPFPMVRNKGRGSGILRTPKVLEEMIAVGCEVMGAGNFSIKARLGVEHTDELLKLMPIVNRYPLRFLTVHGRVARQMYAGECERKSVIEILDAARMPVVVNGDLSLTTKPADIDIRVHDIMVGRSFIRSLGERDDAEALLMTYINQSAEELCGELPVLGRIKELVAYWKDLPRWHKRWPVIKLCRGIGELKSICYNVNK